MPEELTRHRFFYMLNMTIKICFLKIYYYF